MSNIIGSVTLQEQRMDSATWVAVRARGADWSWLTREEALGLAHHLIEKYEATREPTARAH